MKNSYLSASTLLSKLLFSGFLALILVACGGGSSGGSSSSPTPPVKAKIKFEFSTSNITIQYAPGLTTSNTVTVENIDLGKLLFESDTTSVANVNSSGVLSIEGVGTATIKVTRLADSSSEELTTTFLLTVLKGNQSALVFAQNSITTTTELIGEQISNTATGGTGTGSISYSIDNTSVATIDANTGELTIRGAGTAKITATKVADALYNATASSYILTVNKKNQTGFYFSDGTKEAVTKFTRVYEKEGKINQIVTKGGQSTGRLSYDTNDTNVATINSDGEITIKGVGTAIITATKAGDAKYNPITTSYTLTIIKAGQTGFIFTRDSVTIGLVNSTASNIPTGGQGTGLVSYEIDNTSVATIDPDSGVLTINGVGTATITATKAGDANYHAITAKYTLIVNRKSDQTSFRFTQDSITLTYVADATTTNLAIGAQGTGTLSYSVDNTSVATVDNDGEITIKGAGTATITATKAADANHNTATISYILTVNKAQQTNFKFPQDSIIRGFIKNTTVNNIATGAVGTGELSYSIDDTSVATIDADGVVTIKDLGTATITATKAGDANHNGATISYTLIVNGKKDQTTVLNLAKDSITLVYEAGITTSNVATGGTGTGAISYESDNTSVATVDSSGQVTIKGAGTAIITATKAGDDTYNPIEISYVLTVNKAEQPALSFSKNEITLVYAAGATTMNVATGGTGTGAISYHSDNISVATVDNKGEITIKGGGTAIITATKKGNANYKDITTSYTLTVNRAEQPALSFSKNSITIVYVAGGTTSNVATGGTGTGAISYHSDTTKVVTVDSSGVVTMINVGTATITATKAADTNYNSTAKSYVITITKANQQGFGFIDEEDGIRSDFTIKRTIQPNENLAGSPLAVGGQGTGAISYSIDSTRFATIDARTGIVTMRGIGTAKITATKAGDNNYESAEASYTFIIDPKSQQTGF